MEQAPVNQPRFYDRLSDDDEALWRELVDSVQSADFAAASVFRPMWADPAIPQAFRDRAMLYLEGPDDALRNGVKYTHANQGRTPFSAVEHVLDPELAKESAAIWYSEVIEREAKTDERILADSTRLVWGMNALGNGYITSEQFDAALELCDPVKLANVRTNTIIGRSDMSDDAHDYMPRERFPLLHDALSSQAGTVEPGPIHDWAIQKLHLWTMKQNGAEVELPTWLQAFNESPWNHRLGRDLYAQLVDDLSSKSAITWDDIKPAIEHYGWPILERRASSHAEYTLPRITNQPDQINFVEYVFQVNAAYALVGRDMAARITPAFLEQAQLLAPELDQVTLDALNAEVKRQADYEAERQRRSEAYRLETQERDAEREARQEAINITRQAAAERIANLLTRLRS